jgi:MSHA biogenesis protein MshK
MALGAAPLAFAQPGLADPTRPAPVIAVAAAGAGEAELAAVAVLQSVLTPEKGKPVAIIGGRQVRIGEMVGDKQLVKLGENEAVLVGPAGSERLLLTPGVEKKNVTAAPGAKRVRKGEKQ